MNKNEAIERLDVIKAASENDMYNYEVVVNDWIKYGKDRTYLSIVERKEGTKHYSQKKYGYFDNVSGEYVPDVKNDLREDYTFGDRKF